MIFLKTLSSKKREDLIGLDGKITREVEIKEASRSSLGIDIRVSDSMGNVYSTELDSDFDFDLSKEELENFTSEQFVGLKGTVSRSIVVQDATEYEDGSVDIRVSDSMGNNYSTQLDEDVSLNE